MADRRQDTDAELTRLLKQLPGDIEPKADLWPGIAEAIAQDSVSDDSIDAVIFETIPADIEPEVDLWPGIESRIRQVDVRLLFNRPSRRRPYLLLAASLAVVAITGALLVRGPERIDGPATGPDMTSAQPGSRGVPVTVDDIQSDLLFPPPSSTYAGDIQATLREHIAAVRGERMRIEESLNLYPADPALRQLWRNTYAAELKLVDTAERVLSTI